VYLFWKDILKRCLTPTVDKDLFEKFRIFKINITRAIEEVNSITLRKVGRNMLKRVLDYI
jgi:post-segregation antitoxin (ccd killing protein)